MKFGLWFATAWGAESAWDNPAAFRNGQRGSLPWREGYPITREGVSFCIGDQPYYQMLKKAVLYHIKENGVRLVKFDGGDYVCNLTDHTHLPGKYSVDTRFENLIDIATAARTAAPDVFVMWYWGLRSPFWALHGDMLFESGLMMEGSATSAFPALYYRDSVSLAQDQNAQHATNIPPTVKDSLGVWLADDRWGNYMGKQRWREAMVMDLARGNMCVPNLWGDIYLFNDDDVYFLSRVMKLAKKHESILQHRHKILGDPWRNDVYGYAYGQDAEGLVFMNNMHFASRHAEVKLDAAIGLTAAEGTPLTVQEWFPLGTSIRRPDGKDFKIGDTLSVWLRPFESLAIEVKPRVPLVEELAPRRSHNRTDAANLGISLPLTVQPLTPAMDIRFADAGKFEAQQFKKKSYAFETTLPDLQGDHQPILSVVIRLRQGSAEWRYKPPVVQIAQAVARVDGNLIQMFPVPDGRQYGNTQGIEGCSWLVYKVPLNRAWSNKKLSLAIHAYLPEGVEAQTEAWIVKRWWQEDPRPTPNGFYTDEPS